MVAVMGKDSLSILKTSDVVDPLSFAKYVQQRTGTPYPTTKNMIILRKKIKDFFDKYPNADYATLCRIVEWAKGKKKRFAQTYQMVDAFRYAWSAGYLPELDPKEEVDESLEKKIEAALDVETDPEWRRRLMVAYSIEGRRIAYDMWVNRG